MMMGAIVVTLTRFPFVGTTRTCPCTGAVCPAGQTAPVQGQVLVVPTNGNRVSVTTIAPIIIQASSLGLAPGIDALREIAGLPSIGYSVPVTFSLTFAR